MITHPINGSINEIVTNLIASLQNDNYPPTRIRVMAVSYLILTGTAEHVDTLTFSVQGDKITRVDFVGIRKNHYTNVEPYRIEFSADVSFE